MELDIEKIRQDFLRELDKAASAADFEQLKVAYLGKKGRVTELFKDLDVYKRQKLDRDRLARFDIWLAQWNDEPTYDGQYGMWQHTSDGSVPGINGRVDLNVTTGYRDYPAHIGAQYETPPAPAEPTSRYSPGDRVHVKSTLYADSNGNGAGKSVDGEYTIDRVLPGRRAGILIGGGLGWVPEGNCAPAGTYAPPVMAVGVQVRYTGRVYATATGDGAGQTMNGTYTVDRYLPARPYGVHIPAGWVRECDCIIVG